jgi:Fic family protein
MDGDAIYARLTSKQALLAALLPLSKALTHNLDEWLGVELAYTSNAIEGNTLTRRETAAVIEKGTTVGGKSLREHLEAVNHAQALEAVRSLAKGKPSKLAHRELLDIHSLILKGIDDTNTGRYRNVPVRISGSTVVLPNPIKVPALMSDFFTWLTARHKVHPVAFAAEAHYRLVTIHPFADGNGRTARLLMNLLLMMQGYPPAIIRKRDRTAYIASLESAQLGGPRKAFDQMMAKAADRTLDIYLKAAHGESTSADLDTSGLMKIGQLAKAAGTTVPTIRYWTSLGLLEIAETTASGYQIYAADMVERCAEIKRLQRARLTLDEIRQRIAEV